MALKCIHKSICVDSQIHRTFLEANVVDECLCCICHAMSAAYTGSSANLHENIIFAGICSTEARLPLHKSFWRQVGPSCLPSPQMGSGGCGQHCCRLCRGPGAGSRCPAGSSCCQESGPPPTGTGLCRSAWYAASRLHGKPDHRGLPMHPAVAAYVCCGPKPTAILRRMFCYRTGTLTDTLCVMLIMIHCSNAMHQQRLPVSCLFLRLVAVRNLDLSHNVEPGTAATALHGTVLSPHFMKGILVAAVKLLWASNHKL